MRTDASTFLGDYPYRGFPSTSLAGWKEIAERYEIHHAAVSSFHELFWENNFDASWRFADELRDETAFTHFVVVNPVYPRQLEDLPVLLEGTGAGGIRLFPGYHEYRLWDARVGELFKLAAERNWPVQIFQEIQDVRLHWMHRVPAVDITEFQWLLAAPPPVHLLLSGLDFSALNSLAAPLREAGNVWVDLSRVRGPLFAVERLTQTLGAEHLMMGSLWPIQMIGSSYRQIEEAQIAAEECERILGANWSHFASQTDARFPALALHR